MKVTLANASIDMRSNPKGKCLSFGKQRCKSANKDLEKKQKALPRDKRCKGRKSECKRFVGKSNFLPDYNPNFILPQRETEVILKALRNSSNILLVGPPGTGKTSLAKQLAAFLNWGLLQFSCSEETSSSKILGQWIIAGKDMKWSDGYVTTAMKRGLILLEDEADFMRPELRGELHSVMENQGSLTLSSIHPDTHEPYQEVIKKHKDFRWISTANTTGHGDDAFQYQGTQYMNSAARDRYDLIIDFQQKPPEIEKEILIKENNIDEEIANEMVGIANTCRENLNKDITFQFSLRRLLAWSKYYESLGPESSSALAILNFCNDTDRHFIRSLMRTNMNIEVT